MPWYVFVLFSLSWAAPWISHAATYRSPCEKAGGKISTLLATRLPAGLATEADSVRSLVHALRDVHHLPISFIEDQSDKPLKLEAAEHTLEEVLAAVVKGHAYRCEAYSGRLVLRSTDAIFDHVIRNVDVVDEYRFPAMRAYLEKLRLSGEQFAGWVQPLVATAGDGSRIFDGRVTLSPRAPVALHLVQLLGRDQAVYFTVPALRDGRSGRTITFGAIKEPWERIPPLAAPSANPDSHE